MSHPRESFWTGGRHRRRPVLVARELTPRAPCIPWLLLLLPCLAPMVRAGPQETAPMVPGLRQGHPLDEVGVGRLLLTELRCTACHVQLRDGLTPVVPAPDLSEVGWRVAPDYLRRFLDDPQRAHPGTRMPGLLGSGGTGSPESVERDRVLEALTHFLVAGSSRAHARGPVEEEDVAAGRALFHGVGCVACHAPTVGPAEGVPAPDARKGAVGLGHVAGKYSLESLADFLFQPGEVRPSGRMPDLGLSRSEARSIASFLIGAAPVPFTPLEVRPQLASLGRQHFEQLACAACHEFEGVQPPPPVPLEGPFAPGRGCLTPDRNAGQPGAAGSPRFALDDAQRSAIAAALAAPAPAPADEAVIASTLVAFNCVACHVRDDYGGVASDLDAYFTTSEPGLGDEARIPPPLTLTGAKLQREWMHAVLFESGSVRDYMHTRMPQFGEANLAHLPGLFERADAGVLEPFEMPLPEGDARKVARDAGRELMGVTGLSCISCHDFNGKPSPNYGGIDLVNTPLRLEPSWFAAFMVDPQAYRPDVVMPQSWPGGVAVHDGILDGDTDAQIRAIWYFLTQGRSAADPRGISAIRTSLGVTDTTRTYRGRSGIAGYRGIAVGFPGGLNYAFNANTGSLAGIWRGDFVTTRWDGQGAGDFNPAARAVSLAQDVSFWRLEDHAAPWPLRPRMDKENPVNPDPLYPRNHGYRFRGYFLDADLVPTFLYESGVVSIEDRSDADLGGERPVLRRSLRLSAAAAQRLWFRALTGDLEALSAREFQTPKLRLRIPDAPTLLRALDGEEAGSELLLELALPAGDTLFTLEYELLP